MTNLPTRDAFAAIGAGYNADASRSMSLKGEAYVDPRWYRVDLDQIIAGAAKARLQHTGNLFDPVAQGAVSHCFLLWDG